MRSLAGFMLIFACLSVPAARADLLFVGSQAGLCCYNVDLEQVSSTDVLVTATLTDGAQWFVDTGSGQHPGFAFNITGDPGIAITNLSSPWTSSEAHLTSVVTGGPALGTFDYFIDNPGPGASAKNAGPLSFDVTLASGLSVNDFVANSAGYYYVADIMDAAGATGLSGINAAPTSVPEPTSIYLFGAVGFGVMISLRRRLPKGSK